jgi:hypothetical protein
MAAGGPGDYWLTDILQWNLPAFGAPVDDLVRDIVRLGGHKEIEDGRPLARILDKLWWPPNRKGETRPNLDELRQALTLLRDRLEEDAIRGGWEVR